ncbi:hypothetical protein HID58_036955 [Brassica napus]|uniref:Uncharacterized protein n=2 Tax=Brassica napus TaxID=3708 RepID=A0ABQ8C994_BRANA|nr:hypothetical protein HID58_036955 [Brassica napus]CDY32541.1 BnaA09g50550D [Brassica napus]
MGPTMTIDDIVRFVSTCVFYYRKIKVKSGLLKYDAFLLEHPLHYEKWIEYENAENSLGSKVGNDYNASLLWNTIIGFKTKHDDWNRLAMVYTSLLMHLTQHLDDYLTRPEYWVRYVLCMHKRHLDHYVDKLIDRATKLVFPKFITDSDVLTRLYQLLARDDTEGIQKRFCWIISRLTNGKGAPIEDVLGTEIYDKTVNVLKMRKSSTCGMLFGSN